MRYLCSGQWLLLKLASSALARAWAFGPHMFGYFPACRPCWGLDIWPSKAEARIYAAKDICIRMSIYANEHEIYSLHQKVISFTVLFSLALFWLMEVWCAKWPLLFGSCICSVHFSPCIWDSCCSDVWRIAHVFVPVAFSVGFIFWLLVYKCAVPLISLGYPLNKMTFSIANSSRLKYVWRQTLSNFVLPWYWLHSTNNSGDQWDSSLGLIDRHTKSKGSNFSWKGPELPGLSMLLDVHRLLLVCHWQSVF